MSIADGWYCWGGSGRRPIGPLHFEDMILVSRKMADRRPASVTFRRLAPTTVFASLQYGPRTLAEVCEWGSLPEETARLALLRLEREGIARRLTEGEAYAPGLWALVEVES
jgi:hypothetical protein